MKHLIDTETWERRDNWRFMKEFANSWYAVTSEVDCTVALAKSKQQGTSFFIHYLYAILRSANEVKELGYRPTPEGGVCWFDKIGATVPVAVPGKTFYTVLIPYEENEDLFYTQTQNLITHIPPDGDPYGVNSELIRTAETGVVNISATPKLYFTGMTYTFHKPGLGSDWPLINVGKAISREDKKVMPISIYVDHCFVDGAAISDFFEKVQYYLNL